MFSIFSEKKCPRSVTNFCTNMCFVICFDLGGFWVLNGPPLHPTTTTTTPIPGRGKKYVKNVVSITFYGFYEKTENVLKWLRRVAFVGWDAAEAFAYVSQC